MGGYVVAALHLRQQRGVHAHQDGFGQSFDSHTRFQQEHIGMPLGVSVESKMREALGPGEEGLERDRGRHAKDATGT